VAFLNRVTWTATFDRQLRGLRKAERKRAMDAAERLDTEGLDALRAYPLEGLPEDLVLLAGGRPVWAVDVPEANGLKMTLVELEDGIRLLTCVVTDR
jgi:hypothetical protein